MVFKKRQKSSQSLHTLCGIIMSLSLCIAVCLITFSPPHSVNAQKNNANPDIGKAGVPNKSTKPKQKSSKSEIPESGLLIAPELPKDNIGGRTLGYFNITNKSHEQHLRIKLYNTTEHTVHVTTRITDAITLDDGQVDYTGSKAVNRMLLQHPGSQQISVPHKLTLPKNSERWLPVKIAGSKTKFSGRKASAVVIETEDTNQSSQSSIQNKYVYAIGLTLNGKKIKKKQYQTAFIQEVATRMVHKQAYISTNLVNPDPMYLKNVDLKIKLINKKFSFFNYSYKRQKVKVAPNSDFWANLALEGKRLVPGDYQMKVTLKSNRYSKQLTKSVRITKHEAYLINSKNEAWLHKRNLLLIVSGLIAILIIMLIVIWYRKRVRASHDYETH